MPSIASSVHEGVSCDSCMKPNFAGDRFKCLRCYDFDLCRECYENSRFRSAGEHTVDHSVQCIMTQQDFELAYWGETDAVFDQSRIVAYTCPHCGQTGLNQTDLYEHSTQEHQDLISLYEVICPICLGVASGDPNRLTDDLAAHLAAEHLKYKAELKMEQILRHERSRDDESSVRRRQFHNRQAGRKGRQQNNQSNCQSLLSGRPPPSNSAGNTDPIAELLTQLGGIRRGSNNYSTTLAQIQQLQQQIGRRTARSNGHQQQQQQQQPSSTARVVAPTVLSCVPGSAYNHSFEGEPLHGLGGVVGTDGGLAQLWSELVGSSTTNDSSAFSHMLRTIPTSTSGPQTSAQNQIVAVRTANPSAQTTPLVQQQIGIKMDPELEMQDPRCLMSRVWNKLLNDEERQNEQQVLADRSEFVSELLLDLLVNTDLK